MPRVQTETRSRRRPSITGRPERRPGDRSIWGLFLVFGMAEAAIVPFLPLLLQDHGYSGSQIGLALAAMALAALLATPAWGHLGDVHLSLSRAFACAATATALCSLLLGVARGPAFVAALVALAACRSALTPLSDALALAQLASRRTRYGTVRMWLSAGFAAAAIGWGLVLAGAGIGAVPVVYAAALLATTSIALVLRSPPAARERGRSLRDALAGLAGTPGLLPFLLAVVLVNASFLATSSFFSLRVTGLGGGLALVGLAAGLQAAIEVPVMRATASAHHGHLFLAGCLTYAVAFALFALTTDPLVLSLLRLLSGVGFAFLVVGTVVAADHIVEPQLRASGQAVTRASTYGLSPIVGGIGGGLIWQWAGAPALFAATSAAALLGAILYRATRPVSA
jgi:PPP family 3-phenylpropionic acid transporter